MTALYWRLLKSAKGAELLYDVRSHQYRDHDTLFCRITKINHLGIAVKNLDEAIAFYRDTLGLDVSHVEEFEDMRIAFIPVGESELELLEPTDPDGAIGRYIAKYGPGIQHVAFEVDDVDATVRDLQAKGAQLIDTAPRPGADNTRIAFLHPKGAGGVLIEVCQYAGER